ncbi:MAG: hypothetical protein PHY09_11255 [Desulfuromonadaceae bacterium]|nr:hypothetical protein [Desulfuromonadaceae bacterium]MDD5106134.1 hypothetical protein [Desulfuromonadaceae bacterium]
MSRLFRICVALFICVICASAASAAGKRPADAWNYYHFDGTSFVAGPTADGSAFIAVRENALPIVLTAQKTSLEQTALSEGTGVIAGICYLQSSGGKLGGSGGFTPYPQVSLLISSGGKQYMAVQTDAYGYFTVSLPAGTYAVGSGPITARVTVERGITTLVPLRVGKRMAD